MTFEASNPDTRFGYVWLSREIRLPDSGGGKPDGVVASRPLSDARQAVGLLVPVSHHRDPRRQWRSPIRIRLASAHYFGCL